MAARTNIDLMEVVLLRVCQLRTYCNECLDVLGGDAVHVGQARLVQVRLDALADRSDSGHEERFDHFGPQLRQSCVDQSNKSGQFNQAPTFAK